MASLALAADSQLRGMTGRRPGIPYNQMLIAQLPAAREAYKNSVALKEQRDQLTAAQEFQQEQQDIQKDQANKASLIQGGNTALTLGAMIGKDNLLTAGKYVGTKLKTIAKPVLDKLTGTAAKAAADQAAITGAGITAAATEGSLSSAAGGVPTTGGLISDVAGGIGDVVSVAAPYYALAKAGGMAINAFTDNNPKYKDTPLGLLGEGLRNPITGVERSVGDALADHGVGNKDLNRTIAAILNPSSLLQDLGGGCIIVTACTDRNSPEVEITRKYRDRFLDADQLRGYYVLAERVVPLLERNETARKNVKKWLVDRLIDYGSHRLDLKKKRPALMSYVVAKMFLATIKTIGMIVPQYVRTNGEVY